MHGTARRVAWLLVVLLFYSGCGKTSSEVRVPALSTAIVRADNDYAFEKPYLDEGSTLAALPEAVRERICEETRRYWQWLNPEEGVRYADMFGPVFRLRVPDREGLDLYVYKLHTIPGYFRLVLLLHDVRTGGVTSKPVSFAGRWMGMDMDDPLVRRPLIDFDDLNLDGRSEVVFQQRIHNGTMVNAVVYHYLHIGDDLSLIPIFRLETRLVDLWREPDGYIVRFVEKQAPNRIVVRAFLSNDPFSKGDSEVGHVVLESADASSRFRVKEEVVTVEKYDGLLLDVYGGAHAVLEQDYLEY